MIYTAAENGALQSIQFDSSTNQILYDYVNEQLKTVKYGSQTLDYDFNENGKLTKLTLFNHTLADFSYDKNGLDTKTSFGNQTSAIENVYKGISTQLQIENFYSTSGTAPWNTNAYTYDANGQITSITNNSGTTTYTYDAFNQLTKETLPDGQIISYTYDTVGNRTAKAVIKNGVATTTNYKFNNANQMTNAGAVSYSVDRNGNTINDDRYQYIWNAFDQLTSVIDKSNNTIATYKYDENGRRIYSEVNDTETYYRYDGTSNHVLFEENTSGAITKAYTYNVNGHPLTMTYDDEIYYYLTNYRGDVLALTDTYGAVVVEYTYDAWGNILTQKDLDNLEDVDLAKENPYRYAGYRYDEETKLYYLMARYYNPDTGVFLSLDSVRGEPMNPITMNGYNYANNNPVMNVDSNGEFAIPLIYAPILAILAVGMVWYGMQSLQALLPALNASFAKIKVRPTYKSKYEVHHIVAQKAAKATSARNILRNVGIGVNDGINLVSIKTGLHRRLHTNQYYSIINTLISSSYNSKHSYSKNRKNVTAMINLVKVWLTNRSGLSLF